MAKPTSFQTIHRGGALLLDPELRVTWANDAFCGLFGLLHKELIGRELKDLVEEPDAVQAGPMEGYGSVAPPSSSTCEQGTGSERSRRLRPEISRSRQTKLISGGRS